MNFDICKNKDFLHLLKTTKRYNLKNIIYFLKTQKISLPYKLLQFSEIVEL